MKKVGWEIGEGGLLWIPKEIVGLFVLVLLNFLGEKGFSFGGVISRDSFGLVRPQQKFQS